MHAPGRPTLVVERVGVFAGMSPESRYHFTLSIGSIFLPEVPRVHARNWHPGLPEIPGRSPVNPGWVGVGSRLGPGRIPVGSWLGPGWPTKVGKSHFCSPSLSHQFSNVVFSLNICWGTPFLLAAPVLVVIVGFTVFEAPSGKRTLCFKLTLQQYLKNLINKFDIQYVKTLFENNLVNGRWICI